MAGRGIDFDGWWAVFREDGVYTLHAPVEGLFGVAFTLGEAEAKIRREQAAGLWH